MKNRDFKSLNFLTASEIAQKLKMNHQVVLRKLQKGEIEGYKLGKDWRVEEEKIFEWLEKSKNRARKDFKTKTISAFFEAGKLKHLPSSRKKRQYVLEEILKNFEKDRVYTEKEVNHVISKFHEDFCTIRREFIMFKMMQRKNNKYKVSTSYKFLEK